MMKWLLTAMRNLWQWWRNDYISVKLATAYITLLSSLFFFLGGNHPPAEYQKIEQELADAKSQIRQFANEIARRNGLLNNMRARDKLNKKTLDLLNTRLDDLELQNVRWQEENTFYRHLFETKTTNNSNEVVIHALDANPDFARKAWKLSAILTRPSKRRAFKGGYYFEIVISTENGEHNILRLPESGSNDFQINFYHEIEEILELSPENTIEDLRLVVQDPKGKQVASIEMGGRDNDLVNQPNGDTYIDL